MTYQSRGTVNCLFCEKLAIGRKLCRHHYYKMHRAKRLDEFPILAPEDIFESRIDKTGSCWIWTGTKNSYGYGIILLPGEISVRAHRYSYEYFVGKIPEGKIVMHTCDNPPCVNPAHLRIGTKKDNNQDTANKRRHNYGTDHWNGRLTNDDIKAIRESQEGQYVLAKIYGVCQSHISRIKNGGKREKG